MLFWQVLQIAAALPTSMTFGDAQRNGWGRGRGGWEMKSHGLWRILAMPDPFSVEMNDV